jgi:hypothetical protein
LQNNYFSAVDLSQIAQDLDEQEIGALMEGDGGLGAAKFTSQNYGTSQVDVDM